MKLDIRCKIFLLGFANLIFFFRLRGWIEGLVLATFFLLFFLLGQPRLIKRYAVIFLLFLGVDIGVLPFVRGHFSTLLSMLTISGRFVLPTFMAGSLLFATSNSYELIHGLKKWRCPEIFLLTFAVMLRFLPMIRQDFRQITQALKVRGLFLKKRDYLLKAFSSFEYIMVPLLMALIRTSHELTVASLTKGLVIGNKQTESFPSRFERLEWGICVWISLLVVIIMYQSLR